MGLLTRDRPAPAPAEAPPRDAIRRYTWNVHREAQLRDLRWRLERATSQFMRDSYKRQIKLYEDEEPPDSWRVDAIDGAVTEHRPRPPRDARGREQRRLEPHEFYPPGLGFAPETPVGSDEVWVVKEGV